MTLQQFYNDYAAWLDAGAPEDRRFYRGYGLCDNLYSQPYCNIYLMNEMKGQFKTAGLDIHYPFGGSEVFEYETDNLTFHLNPSRIQWVKDHANNQ